MRILPWEAREEEENNMLAANLDESFFGKSGHFLSTTTGVGTLTSNFLSTAVAIAGVVFLILVVIAGYKMLSGAGGNPAQFKQGQEIITSALIGLILVMIAFWIVGILQRSLGVTILY